MRRLSLFLLAVSTSAVAAGQAALGVEVEVSTVVIDVRVRGADGAHLAGLASSSFRVFEDDVERPVESVREVRHGEPFAPAVDVATPAIGDEPAPAVAFEPIPPRRFVFFFDLSNITTRSRVGLRKAGTAVAEWSAATLGPEDRVSILSFDRRQTRVVVDDRAFTPEIGDILVAMSGGDAGPFLDPAMRDELAPVLVREREVALRSGEEQRSRRMRLVESLEALAVRLEGRPGPKVVVLLSEGMALDGFAVKYLKRNVYPRFQEADVEVHTLSTLGLEAPIGRARGGGPVLGYKGDLWAEVDYRTQLAGVTGGEEIEGTVGFARALGRVTTGLGSYYQLSYTPPERAPGDEHEIRVEVDDDRVRELRYRRVLYVPEASGERSESEERAVLARALGSSVAEAGVPLTDLRLAPLPNGDERAWLGVIARIDRSWFAGRKVGTTVALQIVGEVRNRLGVPVARLDDSIELPLGQKLHAALAAGGLEYLAAVDVRRERGELRLIVTDLGKRKRAAETLPFDLTAAVATGFVFDEGSRPVRIRGNRGAGGPAGRLLLGKRKLHPQAGDRVRAGERATFVLELGRRRTAPGDRVAMALVSSGSNIRLERTRFDHVESGARSLVVVQGVVPAGVAPGAYEARASGRLGGRPMAAVVPVVVQGGRARSGGSARPPARSGDP